MAGKRGKTSFSLGEKIGFFAMLLALVLFYVSPVIAILPLVAFVILCFTAPFFPGFSFYLPIISRGRAGIQEVALTFDDGPSPLSTPVVLRLLERHNIHATFFVIGEKAALYPDIVENILANGHSIGNHSWTHDYFLMLRSQATVEKDIRRGQEVLKQYGVRPLVFRPPVGITGSRLGGVLAKEGLVTLNYSCRALDRGNRCIDNLGGKILSRVEPGAIIMLHDLPPQQRTDEDHWENELDFLFAELQKKYTIAPLEVVIERPVMADL